MSTLDEIAARDAEWIEHDGRLVYQWTNIRGETKTAPHATDGDGPADRRYLLGLVREAREALRKISVKVEADSYHRNHRAAMIDIDAILVESRDLLAVLTEGSDRT